MDLTGNFFTTATYNNYLDKMCSTIKSMTNKFLALAVKAELHETPKNEASTNNKSLIEKMIACS